MTIKIRLWIMVLVSIVGLAVVFIAGRYGIHTLQQHFDAVSDDRLPKLVLLEELLVHSIQLQRDVREIVLQKNMERQQAIVSRLAENREWHKVNYAKLGEVIRSEEGKALLAKAITLRAPVAAIHNKVMALSKEGKTDEAIEALTNDAALATVQAYRDSIEAMIEREKSLASQATHEGKADGEFAQLLMLIGTLTTLLVLIVIALIVIRNVSTAISGIVMGVANTAKTMRFDQRLPRRKDELNLISESLNSLLASFEHAVNEANEVIGALEKGEFSQRVSGEYVGDLDKLKQAINGSADNITSVMQRLSNAMIQLQEGKFTSEINLTAPGAYGQMLHHVSQTMAELNNVVGDIHLVMGSMNEGDFSARVTVSTHGDLQAMKDAVNTSMERLSVAMISLSSLVSAQAHGDLMQSSTVALHGQLKLLQDDINVSMSKLREVVTAAIESSSIVSAAALQVSQGSADLSGRVQEQAAAIEETSATMHEMAAAIQTNTDNARKVSSLANEVTHRAGEGKDVMQQTIDAMQSIRESSNKISEIVTIIDSIAFQTNLLALNAAVEAARAGEHGRGFAVVASEVRALAGKSADAAKDIKLLIQDSVNRVESGTALAEQSGAMLNDIAESVVNVTQMIQEITVASEEQAEGINQVNQAITQIDSVTQQNATLVEETTSAALSLSSEAGNLQSNMAFFNVGQSNTSKRLTS